MIPNPFTFGNPIRDPDRFHGREREVRQIAGRLLSPAFESTSVVGERRIGKTSLLLHLAHPKVAGELGLTADRYILVYLDFQGCTDITPVRFWSRVLHQVARALSDKELAALARELRAQPEIDQYDLEDLFMEVENRGLRLVLLLDEFDYVTQNPNFGLDFFAGLRALAIHSPLALVTATRDELVDLCHSDTIKGSPFFNIFATVILRPFSREEALALLGNSVASTPVAFSDVERAYLSDIAGGHPIFVQMAGYYCFEGHQMRLQGDALRSHVTENFRQQADPHFTYLWSHCTESEDITLLTLLALTREKKAQPTHDQLLKAYPRAGYILPDLLKRGLVLERDRRFDIFSPLFADWLLVEISAGAGEETDEQTAQEWLEKRGGIERSTRDRIRQTFPKLKQRYWSLLGAFLRDTSAEVAASLILSMGKM